MEGKDNVSPENIGPRHPTTPPPNDSNWVMHAINQLDGRIDKLDERLRAVENKISKAMGWGTAMFLLLVVIQVVLKFANVSISIN